ncbi:hypothetical protein DCAR_0414585 [Daucus carota subsp. sativus]|uniref:Uncharacterized protein n=1 Tax=Daucus carota subsp. sativus TaxID=79200 RepID=A0A175YE16_DAUCS|nr:PREDICTED: agamous-like MADS-box protein AGL81 [Daucus carota subsp. sativus]WOG95273.1 hypothetical protein DCAR_0414585 [Daucus carota subsp. sativus]
MGRAKSRMEFVKKEKHRNSTFQKRNANLKKKLIELATLCDIKALVIVYGPEQGTPPALPLEPQVWPEDRDEVHQLIDKYKGQSPEDCKKRTTLLSDFFQERNKKAQQTLAKLRNTNVNSKYPTWDSRFESFKEEDLRKTVNLLEINIGNAKARLEQMKANNIYGSYQEQQQQRKRRLDFDPGNQAPKYLKIEPYQAISDPMRMHSMPIPIPQQRFPFIDHNWNQMMVKFGNEYVGVVPNIVHNANPSYGYDYPTMAGTLNGFSYPNNFARAPLNYYGDGMQPIAQHVMEYHSMTEGSTSHQMLAASHQFYEDRKWQR